MRSQRYIILILISSFLLAAGGCAVNPVTGKKELMLISEAQEIEMGKQTDQGIRQQYGLYDNPAMTAYVRRVGQSLTPFTHRRQLKYHFAILDTPVPNAFAAPGGYIYITRGLMAMMNSEAEMAVVLGHELGHVNARHSARSMSRQLLFNIGLVVGSVLSKDVRRWAPLAGLAGNLLFLKFSRSDEYQADSLGIQYSRSARYRPGAMISFFQSLQQLTAGKSGGLPNFLSTHPLTNRRIEEVREMLQPGDKNMKVARNDYIRRMDGLVYGNNPRQGFVQGNAFYHPDMRFMFRIPSGWKVQNTPAQVTMADADGNAVVLFRAQQSKASLNEFAEARLTAAMKGANVLDRDTRSLNSLSSHHILFESATQAESENPPMRGLISCIRKNGMIFTFIGLTEKSRFATLNQALSQPARSFTSLKDRNYLNRRPTHVRVVRVSDATRMDRFLSQQKIPQKLWKPVFVLNRMQADSQLTQGQLVKVIK